MTGTTRSPNGVRARDFEPAREKDERTEVCFGITSNLLPSRLTIGPYPHGETDRATSFVRCL